MAFRNYWTQQSVTCGDLDATFTITDNGGGNYTFDASALVGVSNYTWTVSPATGFANNTGNLISDTLDLTFSVPSTYTIRLDVSDGLGGTGFSQQQVIYSGGSTGIGSMTVGSTFTIV